ncbi:hypothetical protein F5X99DRAFT_317494 [Biscogniauxia marginata]|nr:hypothetical protein F5X99DRAFT_317494 [Biscogniauxia marginata]
MSSLADLFPPGTDLCQLPSGNPPAGQSPNFHDPGLRSLTISISVILTTIAVVFGLGRLYVNLQRFAWSDLFVFITILCNIAEAVMMIVFVKYFRHMWNVPLCWINGQFEQVSYVWENLLNFSLFFAKTATLLLLHQLFSVSRKMRIAIWIGIAATFAIYAAGLAVTSYFAAPHAGETWDQLLVKVIGTIIFPLYWAVAQGSASTLLDIYIFILPLPVIFRLKLSTKRKIQLTAVFFTAFLGVVASVVSLAYRVISIEPPSPDSTYNAGVLMICNLVEMNVALIICSTTAFATFMRIYVMESRAFKTLRSTLSGSSAKSRSNLANSVRNPNRPRTGREKLPNQKRGGPRHMDGYVEMSETWLLNSRTKVDIEAPRETPATESEDAGGLRVLKTVNVEREPIPPPS